jgi:hypothetical protein
MTATLAWLACAAPPQHPHTIEVPPGYGAGVQKAFLAPMNALSPAPRGLDEAADRIAEQIAGYLAQHGVAVETMSPSDFAARMGAARRRVAATRADASDAPAEDGNVAIAALLDALGADPTIAIFPEAVVRKAEMSGASMAKWDGVRRVQPTLAGYDWSGTTGVASLRVVIFDPAGRRIFDGVGGLDVLFRVNVAERRMELIDEEDRLQDRDHLREGVCVAFHPFFGAEETCD